MFSAGSMVHPLHDSGLLLLKKMSPAEGSFFWQAFKPSFIFSLILRSPSPSVNDIKNIIQLSKLPCRESCNNLNPKNIINLSKLPCSIFLFVGVRCNWGLNTIISSSCKSFEGTELDLAVLLVLSCLGLLTVSGIFSTSFVLLLVCRVFRIGKSSVLWLAGIWNAEIIS